MVHELQKVLSSQYSMHCFLSLARFLTRHWRARRSQYHCTAVVRTRTQIYQVNIDLYQINLLLYYPRKVFNKRGKYPVQNDLNKTNTLRLLINIGPNGSTTLIGMFLAPLSLCRPRRLCRTLAHMFVFGAVWHTGHTRSCSCMDTFVSLAAGRRAAILSPHHGRGRGRLGGPARLLHEAAIVGLVALLFEPFRLLLHAFLYFQNGRRFVRVLPERGLSVADGGEDRPHKSRLVFLTCNRHPFRENQTVAAYSTKCALIAGYARSAKRDCRLALTQRKLLYVDGFV